MGRVVLNDAEIDRLLYGPSGPVVREVRKVSGRVQSVARANAPKDSGAMAGSIGVSVAADRSRQRVNGRIGTRVKYALYQERGTGIYPPGGRGGPIRPRRAKRLRFIPKGGTDFVFAKQVRGTPATHFLVRALRTASPWPVRTLL
jgi:bacteriophage HK97-gp10 putative tail-component